MVHHTKRHRDVFQHYEVLRYLDEGSMGNVQEVRKKVNAIGGSALNGVECKQMVTEELVEWLLLLEALWLVSEMDDKEMRSIIIFELCGAWNQMSNAKALRQSCVSKLFQRKRPSWCGRVSSTTKEQVEDHVS